MTGSAQVRPRDRVIAAIFVAVVLVIQAFTMGAAVGLLGIGLIVAYGLWGYSRWSADPKAILPVYLSGIAVQCLHLCEEYLTGFQREFPALIGRQWTDAIFIAFNLGWLSAFIFAAVGVYRGIAVAYVIVFFYAVAGGIGNGAGHLLLCLARRSYFPGALTAPLNLVIGVILLRRLFERRIRDVDSTKM